MKPTDDLVSERSLASLVIISRDEEFVRRVRFVGMRGQALQRSVVVFGDGLSALVSLLQDPAQVVVYDLDGDAPERNLETLRAIKMICRHVSIILGASDHARLPFDDQDEVGIFYRLLKSAPDAELQTAIRSAQQACRRR